VTVAALTSTTRLATLPGNVAVPQAVSGLDRDSVVNVTQLAAIDRAALEESIGHLPAWLVSQVDDGLRLALSL
jgi:mRNA interferase MazF